MRVRRSRRNHTTVTVNWTHPETDESYSVECDVWGGEKEIRWGDNACPASPPEVEILRVFDESGEERPELMDLVEKDQDGIEESCCEALADDDAGRADDEYDRRREMARERDW